MKKQKFALSLFLCINLFCIIGVQIVIAQTDDIKPAKAKISGVVTYYLDYKSGYVPDVGAKIFIVSEQEILNNKINISPISLTEFCAILDFKNTWLDYKRTGDTPPTSLMQNIIKYQINDTANFNEKDRFYCKQFLEIEYFSKIKRVANSDGYFSVEVDTGKYYVLIKSFHRTAVSLCELRGKPYFKWVTLEPNGEENISPKFSEF